MLLFVVANATRPPALRQSEVRSIASVRIERPAIVNRKEWERAASTSRREIVVRDELGQPVLVRVIEYQ